MDHRSLSAGSARTFAPDPRPPQAASLSERLGCVEGELSSIVDKLDNVLIRLTGEGIGSSGENAVPRPVGVATTLKGVEALIQQAHSRIDELNRLI